MREQGRIRVLPPEIADRIAAGEVVERPASVVKELVENSLDAGATRIRIALEEGGRRRIRVDDDGQGMSPSEARLALQRHATSKIRRAEDLEAIRTLGFRGEALPSIAAVSHLELVTREPGAEFGTRLRVAGGRLETADSVGAPRGTSVRVSQLFFNTPARRQQLRRPATELMRIVGILQGLALAHPGVAFTLEHGGRTVLRTPGKTDLRGAAAALFGPEAVDAWLVAGAINHSDEGDPARVTVYCGRPDAARANRSLQFCLVNGRSVHSDVVREAVERTFRGLLPLHRHPVFVVQVELPAGRVDPNVHPSKRTVRFLRPDLVASLVYEAARRALTGADLIPRIRVGATRTADRGGTELEQVAWTPPAPAWMLPAPTSRRAGSASAPGPQQGRSPTPEAAAQAVGGADRLREGASAHPQAPAGALDRFAGLEVLGVLDRTYIVARSPEGLVLVDQHAAHERVLFEHLTADRDDGLAPRQVLAVPLPVQLDPAAMTVWHRYRETLEQFGFTSEPFGPRTVLLREVPWLYRAEADASLFRDLLDALAATGGTEGALEADLAQRTLSSCKAAVKAHDALDDREIQALLARLDRCRNPYTCPHGRPTILLITTGELERHFKRTG